MAPVTAVRRRRAGEIGPFKRALLEAHDYRPAMHKFFAATRAAPDLLVDVALPDGAVVLDVGGYVGEWSTRILERADATGTRDLHIHAFEPVPHFVDTFRNSLGNDARVTLHPFGLGGRDRTEVMGIGGPGSSLFTHPDHPPAGSADVEIRDVDAVLRSLGIDRIDVLKVNIEGGEYELLDRLHATGWLARSGPLIIQFHEFAPDAYRARRRNRRQLAETHDCVWDYPWVYERWDPKR
jgi:FkbM family methyltransferase